MKSNFEKRIKIAFFRLKRWKKNLYDSLKIYEIGFFFDFIRHRYNIRQFNPQLVKNNLNVLFRARYGTWINANRHGKLFLLTSKWRKNLFSLGNILTFGALRKRVENVIFYTYITLTLELNNPFTKQILEKFLRRKVEFLNHLLLYVRRINGKTWNQSLIKIHIQTFERNSLFQARVIHQMELAVKREKESARVKEAQAALKKGYYPILSIAGASGSYWMRGKERQVLGIFKPFDEEIHAPNNPVGPSHRGALGLRKTRPGCRVGEAAHHEVAAFKVDEFFGFGIVPRTCYATFTHQTFFSTRENRFTSLQTIKTKYGSFQEFVEGFAPLHKLTREVYDSIPLDEFQLLVILDVICGNTDRNIGNILFSEEKIAAIDHGLCFPDTIHDFSYWYWEYLKLGHKEILEPLKELLNHFPFEELEMKLKPCFISVRALQRLRERVVLFTEGVNQGLVPALMAKLFLKEYMEPLRDRKETLRGAAAEQVRLYKETLEE